MGEIGLFPLGIVLLPGERVPLHIFEERYKELIGECLARGVEFGLVLGDRSGIREAGTRAAVVEVLRRFPDGRMDVVVEGRSRFRVVRVLHRRSFLTATVEDLDDEEGEPAGDPAIDRCLAAYRKVAEAVEVEPEDFDRTARGLSFLVAGRIELGVEAKQELLEMRSERFRLLRLAELLEGLVDLLERRRVVRERAAGNGQVIPLGEGAG